LLVSRQGKTRLTKWFVQMSAKVQQDYFCMLFRLPLQ